MCYCEKKTYTTNPKTNFGVSKVAHLMGDQWHIVMCLSVSLLVHKWPSTDQICLSCVLGMIVLPYPCWSLIVFSSTKRVSKICLLSINWLWNRCKVKCLFLVGIPFFLIHISLLYITLFTWYFLVQCTAEIYQSLLHGLFCSSKISKLTA